MSYTIDADWSANGNTNGWTNPRAGYCIHHSAGTSLDMAGTFLAAGTSAHYGIKDDKVRQFVEDGKSVWAAGDNWANNNLIHIECVNSGGAPDWPVSEKTVDTLCEFLANKMKERGETKLVVGQNLYGHKDFFNTFCPGVLYNRLGEIADRVNSILNGEDDMTPEQAKQLADIHWMATRTDDPTGRNVNLNAYEHEKWIAAAVTETKEAALRIEKSVQKLVELAESQDDGK